MHLDSCPLDCKVNVDNLGNKGNKTELEWDFGYQGPLQSVMAVQTLLALLSLSLRIPEMLLTLPESRMEEHYMAAEDEWNCGTVKKRSRSCGPPPCVEDLQEEASLKAGASHFPETGE
ncbi:hypothetical protein LEMLEM_LOCUS16547 [Lemmus lemmus]